MNPVQQFLDEKKAAWLKAKQKAGNQDIEQQAMLESEASEKFQLKAWLPDAAKRAKQITIASHPSKFSHPDAKRLGITPDKKYACDGYLRSGNFSHQQFDAFSGKNGLDVFGNAAALDVYKFLSILLVDNRTVLSHLEENSEEIQRILSIQTISYEEIRESFLRIKNSDTQSTDPLIKQVYFPVNNGYHLLSILTPSGLVTEIRGRIRSMQSSDEAKQARICRKEMKYHEKGFSEIFNLTQIKYGGSNAQNISILNVRNGGNAYLLPCLPPQFDSRQARLPKSNFFKDTLNPRHFKDAFSPLHLLLATDRNNIKVRTSIQKHIQEIVLQVLYQVHAVREQGTRSNGLGWSKTEYFENLPKPQQIWLDDANLDTRQQTAEWLHIVLSDFARWIVNTYKYLFKQDAVDLSDEELTALRDMVEEALFDEGEIFR